MHLHGAALAAGCHDLIFVYTNWDPRDARIGVSVLLLFISSSSCRDYCRDAEDSSVKVTWADAYKSPPSSHTTKIFEFVTVKHSASDIYSRKEMTKYSVR